MESFEEVIRDHLELRGQGELSEERLHELVGGTSARPDVPRRPARERDARPRRRPKRLLERRLDALHALHRTATVEAARLARSVKPAVDAVRPLLPHIGLALAGLAFVTILVPAAVAAARSDRVATGLKVGDVPIGGLSPAEAERLLERRFAAARREPIVLRSGSQEWRLAPSESRLTVDARQAVEAALEHSRRDSFPQRFLDVLYGRQNANLAAPVSFSYAAVTRLADRVSEAIDRPPRNARVKPSGTRLTKVPDRAGVTVVRPALERLVRSRLASAGIGRRLEVPTRSTGARVTVADLPLLYERYVVIRRSEFRLDYFQGLRRKRSYPIAVGMQGRETPAGEYQIQGKRVNPFWSVPRSRWAGSKAGMVIPPGPKNPIKARWMGFDGSAGIHGTAQLSSLGQAASNGCVRMAIPDVKDLYRRVRVGTPVRIE